VTAAFPTPLWKGTIRDERMLDRSVSVRCRPADAGGRGHHHRAERECGVAGVGAVLSGRL